MGFFGIDFTLSVPVGFQVGGGEGWLGLRSFLAPLGWGMAGLV
jgi:hypothetical protein